MFTLEKCDTYSYRLAGWDLKPKDIKRTLSEQKTGIFAAAVQGTQMTLLGEYVDAGLSRRGKWQSECLAHWIATNCPIGSVISGPEMLTSNIIKKDACRLAGVFDRERAVFAVSNLVRTQNTMQFAFKSTRCKPDAPTRTLVHVFDWLQERGCAPDARPASAAGVSASAADSSSVEPSPTCPFDFSGAKSDLCTKSAFDQNNVFNEFMKYVKTTADNRADEPIFYVTGHSSWLQDFFRSKLPLSSGELTGAMSEQLRATEKLCPNDYEIKLTKQKLGNASVVRFEIEIEDDVSQAFIVPGSTQLVYGYFKAEK